MITTRHMHAEVEFVRWLLLALAAIALVLAAATLAAAADPTMEPRLLPADLMEIAKPLAVAPVHPFFPEAPPAREFPPAEAAARLWTILEHQRAGRLADALAGWEQLRLPEATALWREIGMAAAYLQAGDLNQAQHRLDIVRRMAPEQAVAAYFQGVLRLEQRAAVGRVPHIPNLERMRLVALTPRADRAMFEMQAIGELQQAIHFGPLVQLDERLVVEANPMLEAIVVPRVCDLLVATGAENFVGKAHQLLFGLHLDREELAAAEDHLDLATATGIAPLYGYRDLIERLLDNGQNVDAFRILLKDLRTTCPWIDYFRAPADAL